MNETQKRTKILEGYLWLSKINGEMEVSSRWLKRGENGPPVLTGAGKIGQKSKRS